MTPRRMIPIAAAVVFVGLMAGCSDPAGPEFSFSNQPIDRWTLEITVRGQAASGGDLRVEGAEVTGRSTLGWEVTRTTNDSGRVRFGGTPDGGYVVYFDVIADGYEPLSGRVGDFHPQCVRDYNWMSHETVQYCHFSVYLRLEA